MKCTNMKMPACSVTNIAKPSGEGVLSDPEKRISPSEARGRVAMRTTVQNAITAVSSQ